MIFKKNKHYHLQEIIDICEQNGFVTVDCLKDENMISVEESGADCLFEFLRTGNDIFKLSWFEPDINLGIRGAQYMLRK